MGRNKVERKAKRNNFTLWIRAQDIIDKQKNKSKFVSEAIIQKAEFENNKEEI